VSSSRRLLAYGLLLLVPTLLAGLGAIHLLRREQVRLAEREAYAGAARLAAVTARAGLIVESAELLVGDVQVGLLDTLAAMPAAGLDEALSAWQPGNPLVRSAFRGTIDGRILHVAPAGEAGMALRRRLTALFKDAVPWQAEVAQPEPAAPAVADTGRAREEQAARAVASSNVAKMQSARQDVRSLAQSREYLARDGRKVAAAPAPAAALSLEAERHESVADRRGWTAVNAEGRRGLLGWLATAATGEVRGVELDTTALIARLGGVLPAETGGGEGYALRDEQGRIMHQSGWVPRATEAVAVRVPLTGPVLPGWEVVAFLDAPAARSGTGAGFFIVGLLLVGTFMVAILSGGALLLAQARRSELEAAQKTSFVANVSHEFKTPLTTIRLYAELLEQGRVTAAEKRAGYLRTIARETERLARLVGNALDFSRLEQGRKKFAREAVDLRALLEGLLDAQAPWLTEAGLRLERNLPAGPLWLSTDRDACQQIVLNLMDNAVKYAAAGGEIAVSLTPVAEGGATVAVADRGPGVPAAQRERIFEKFHRVDDSLTAEKPGTGLGLSIARQLARGLGGDLRCTARAGGGSVFTFTLP
jgi:two-component system phosphate regulon sensor histidine kinase PhoR